ncbi:hypothetical protein CBR_g19098 [Chara braunii]|nr:hypothetical protein CBR_g19098 [Chara braunii]|eukprot:GBG74693.1 hypothetical protein CBR_g19098 [Chara braunii]
MEGMMARRADSCPGGLPEIAKRLSAPNLNKESILQNLKAANTMLMDIPQSASQAASAGVNACAAALAQRQLLHHRDKEVRLFVASCLSDILRVSAPEAPYEDTVLKDIFSLMVSIFHGLDDLQSPLFSRRVSILESMATVRICVVMLDLDCDDLILELFTSFFDTISPEHPRTVAKSMVGVMTILLEDRDEIPQQLLDSILCSLLKRKREESPAAYSLAQQLLQSCADVLQPYVQRFLLSVIVDGRGGESELVEHYHELIYEIYQVAPQVLITVLPSLAQELEVNQVDKRLKTIRLLARLFSIPGKNTANEYQQLFTDFLKRMNDKDLEVRLEMAKLAKSVLPCLPSNSAESKELLEELISRVMDYDYEARSMAVKMMCELAIAKPRLIPCDKLQNVSDRLRDKKVSVRKEALKSFTELYASHCLRSFEGKGLPDEQFEWIPGRIIKCYYDRDLRLETTQVLLDEQLFPPQLPVEERAKHWVSMFAAFDEMSRKAFDVLLVMKQRLQQELQAYLDLRQQQKDDQSTDMRNKVNTSLQRILGLSVDPSKGMEHLQKLHQIKDNRVFKLLGSLLDHNTTVAEAKTIKEELLKRLGEKHPQREFLRTLASRVSYTMFGKEHVNAIFKAVKDCEFEKNRELLSGAMQLLVEIAGHFPQLLEQTEQDVFTLLKEDDEILKDGAAHILAKAGSHMGELSEVKSQVESVLMKLCTEGTRKQAKHSVSAIAALTGEGGLMVMSLLYDRLLSSLLSSGDDAEEELPTIMQSLGSLAQWAMPVFETRENDIIRFVVKDLLRRNSSQKKKRGDWENPSKECKLKVYGLKMLVKSFLPLRDCPPRPKLKGLLSVLARLVECGEISPEVESSEMDKAHIRLAAAKAVVRLAKRYDTQISSTLFRLTITTVQDSCFQVRKELSQKIHMMLHDRAIPHRFACAFALAVVDVDKEQVTEVKKYMTDFVDNCRREARLRLAQLSEKTAGTTLKLQPEYVLVHLVHVLAHHPDFPRGPDRDNPTVYDPFQMQLAFFLRVLLLSDGEKTDVVKKGDDADNLPAIAAIFRSIKETEDTLEPPKSENVYALCDIGLQIMRELGVKKLWNTEPFPGEIPLPQTLYKVPQDAAQQPRKVDGSHFPKCLLEREGGIKGKTARLGAPVSKAGQQNRKRREEKCESGDNGSENGEMREKGNGGEVQGGAEHPLPKRARLDEKREGQEIAEKEVDERRSGDAADQAGAGQTPKASKRKRMEQASPGATDDEDRVGEKPAEEQSKKVGSIQDDEAKHEGAKRKRESPQFQPEKRSTPPQKTPGGKEYGEELVGRRVKVWWPQDKQFYTGQVMSYNPTTKKHEVAYDDGDSELLKMDKQRFALLDVNPSKLQVSPKNGESEMASRVSAEAGTPLPPAAAVGSGKGSSQQEEQQNVGQGSDQTGSSHEAAAGKKIGRQGRQATGSSTPPKVPEPVKALPKESTQANEPTVVSPSSKVGSHTSVANGKPGSVPRRMSRGVPTPQQEPTLNGEESKVPADILAAVGSDEPDSDESDDMDLVRPDTVEGSVGAVTGSGKRSGGEDKFTAKGGRAGRGRGGKGGRGRGGRGGRGGGGVNERGGGTRRTGADRPNTRQEKRKGNSRDAARAEEGSEDSSSSSDDDDFENEDEPL